MNASGAASPTALGQAPQSNARVDDDRNHARFEERKHQREKVEAGPDHQDGPAAALDPGRAQAQGDLVAVAVELAVSQMRVAHTAGSVSSRRSDDRPLVRLPRGHRHQVSGDVRRLGDRRTLAQPTGSRSAGCAVKNCCTSAVIESASSSNR